MNPKTSSASLTCSMCGYTFDPSQHAACQACPLKPGCQVVCCPNCGFETVDPSRSSLVKLVSRLLRKSALPEVRQKLSKDQ